MKRVVRFTGYCAVAGVALFCVLLLALRFVVFPNVESQRDAIAGWIGSQIGHPVEIDAIVTGWDGWNPEIVVHGLRVRDAAGAVTAPLIELPRVTGVVAWTSLLWADLRLKELVIERPRLAIRRDTAGRLQVGGLEIDPEAATHEPAFAEWVLRQRLIVVRGALLAWHDDLRNAPQLILDRVDLRLENRFGHHRFGLTGTPPAEIAAPLDLRGELSGLSTADWKHARGRLYLRLDYADVAAWSEWLPLPLEVQRGEGALRVWFDFDEGVVREVVADVELGDVRAKLAQGLPPLDMTRLGGRFTWLQDGLQRTLSSRGLALSGKGVEIAPTDVTLRYEQRADGSVGSGRLTVNRLDLAPLAALSGHLPLPARWREDIVRLAPRGVVMAADVAWQGALEAPTGWRAAGTALDASVQGRGGLPGVENVSGAFEATHEGGDLRLGSRNLRIALPRTLLPEPVALDALDAHVRWERQDGQWRVRFDDVAFANAHAAGTAQGWWRASARGPGEVDMQAQLTRADLRQVQRYLPLMLNEGTRRWARESITRGNIEDVRMTLRGDLARYPFPDGQGGSLVVAVKLRDVTLDYASGWPGLSGVDAEVRFENQGVRVAATRGNVLGAALARTTATIPDLVPEHPLLVVEGEASGPTAEFLQFIETSPIAAWIGHFTDGAQAAGHGRLGLRLEMALGSGDDARVRGDFQFADNQLRLPGMLTFNRLAGRLAFTEREMSGRDIAVEVLGGPARVDVATREGTVRVGGRGTLNLALLRNEFASPWTERASGSTDWQLQLTARPGQTTFVVESDLRGATIDLPAPLGKAAAEVAPLRVERRMLGSDGRRDALVVDYAGLARAVAFRQLDASGVRLDRALVTLGKARAAGGDPGEPGIAVRGDVEAVDLDPWLALAHSVASRDVARGAGNAELRSIELNADRFTAFGRRYDDMNLTARRAADGWRLGLAARQVAGQARWEPPSERAANGRFTAQLARLDLFGAPEVADGGGSAARAEGSSNPWPEVDVSAERFYGKAGVLGRLELAGRPEGTDWRVSRFVLVNDAGRIEADGSWRLAGRQQQSRFDVLVEAKDAPAFLARMGLPHDVKGAPTTIAGQIAWPGSPTDFEYATLAGTLRVQSGAGQFTKMNPGVGRLLGVLSLQALPRRITLDFRDVFSEGFAFDTITGNVRIARGVMSTDNLLLAGPAAKVHLAGEVDLVGETQALNVRVQPSLSTVVSTGAGAAAVVLLAANPLVGAAVGAGALLAQKLMQDPIEQMFSYEYAVRGGWAEPLVERLPPRGLAAPAAAPRTEAAAK